MICFAWNGFPQYAARCIGAFVKTTKERVVVVATRPRVPVVGMEKCCCCEIKWIERTTGADELLAQFGECPRVLFVAGWGYSAFNSLRDAVRISGGRIVGLVDNNFVFSFREVLKSIRFRVLIRKHYDGFIVVGKSGRTLLRFYGVPNRLITDGLYSADSTVFFRGEPLPRRPKKVIFVGQLIERKNVRRMCETFNRANVDGDWTLDLYGSGPLREELDRMLEQSNNRTILLHDFLQPEELAPKYREARAFILPSVEEHWGLVVHEAALSGCCLLLSDTVGARADFQGRQNVLRFNPLSDVEMETAFRNLFAMSAEDLLKAGDESAELGLKGASLEKFVKSVTSWIR